MPYQDVFLNREATIPFLTTEGFDWVRKSVPGASGVTRNDYEAMVAPMVLGELFWCSEPIVALIGEASRSIPLSWTLTAEDVLCSLGYMYLAKPWFQDSPEITDPVPWRGVGWLTNGLRAPAATDAICFGLWGEPHGSPANFCLPLTGGIWPMDGTLSQAIGEMTQLARPGNVGWKAQLSFFAATLAFLRQRLLVIEKMQLPRGLRRSTQRSGDAAPSISVIRLREIVRHGGVDLHEQVEWTCRWLVRGHWRMQPYPKLGLVQPKWIAPHIKGPDDKPIKHSERVFAVVR